MIFTPGKRKRQIFQTVANNKEERGDKSNVFCPKPDQALPPGKRRTTANRVHLIIA
jgi:hypothetical protein